MVNIYILLVNYNRFQIPCHQILKFKNYNIPARGVMSKDNKPSQTGRSVIKQFKMDIDNLIIYQL